MELLLDIGNSSINWALQDGSEFTSTSVFSYKKGQIEKKLQKNLLFPEKLSSILVSNVAGDQIFNSVNDWVKKQWGQDCWQANVSAKYKELKNSYNDTEQMGVDRWLAMVASWETYHTALCLVGCGTALTIDVIDIEGKHLGGYIIPGIELMQKALVSNTAQINVDVKSNPSIDYANDTQAAVNNGAFLSTVSMIDRIVETFSNKSNGEVKCIISGGMAKSIRPLLNHPFEYEPNLVLMGLSILHKARQ